MKNRHFLLLNAALAGLAVAASAAFAQTYESQKTLEDELRRTADELGFLEFESESSWGQTKRCQLKYRVAISGDPYKAGEAQIVQGSVTSDYYHDKPINFILNLQPLRLDVNPSNRQAASRTINPARAALMINGLDLSKYQLESSICDASTCIVYAPTKGGDIVDMIKAVQSKSIFDAEIAYSLNKVLPDRTIRLSNIPTHGITNSEVRKQFTNCLNELLKKEVGDLQKLDGAKK
ncbi:MAG: hypothetical protein ACOYNZ_02765 [Rhodoferax sp.]